MRVRAFGGGPWRRGTCAWQDLRHIHCMAPLTLAGVNTGFGGSANTRTQAVEELQRLLLRQLHYGILADGHDDSKEAKARETKTISNPLAQALPLDDPVAATCMPESWVRAARSVSLSTARPTEHGPPLRIPRSIFVCSWAADDDDDDDDNRIRAMSVVPSILVVSSYADPVSFGWLWSHVADQCISPSICIEY